MGSPVILWFRRDLRLSDHPALMAAVASGAPVLPVYIQDDHTPGQWRLSGASRWWLAQSLRSLEAALRARGSRLILRQGATEEILSDLAEESGAGALFFTRGYEPWQRECEDRLHRRLTAAGIDCRRFGGHILFEPEKLVNGSGAAYRVFTPFARTALARGIPRDPLPPPDRLPAGRRWPQSERLEDLRLEPTAPDWAGGLRDRWDCGEEAAQRRWAVFLRIQLCDYGSARDLPATDGTSSLSPHLAFGEISPVQVWHGVHDAAKARRKPGFGEIFMREILWREFSYHLLFHFPALPERPLRPQFEAFPWAQELTGLQAWTRGKTGYPIVDAGMRQLWRTGWMHNRVRMVVASFLIKHLLLPWQEGEAWFWDCLVDADLASNAAGWQWVAGSGADAAPFFRIFNPVLQGEKFDPEGVYVRRWCPELERLPAKVIHRPWEAAPDALLAAGVRLGATYPRPIVEHAAARTRALAAFEAVRGA